VRGRIAVVLIVGLLAGLLATPGVAAVDVGAEQAFLSLVNRERAAHDLDPLSLAGDLVEVARRHSGRMADATDLHHNPNLGTDVTGWQKVGENVGRGPSVETIHDALMNSPGHRANLLDPAYTQVGLGVEERDGRLWLTQVFRQPLAAPAPAPAPAAPEPAVAPSDEVAVAGVATAAPAPAAAAPAPAAAPAAAPVTLAPGDPAGLDRTAIVLARLATADDLVG
jgi:hypothetical protein